MQTKDITTRLARAAAKRSLAKIAPPSARSARWALTLIIALLTATTGWAQNVTYLDESGTEQTCSTYTTMTDGSTSLTAGWYVVNYNVTITDRISVSGTVNLILGNNATLTASKGITVGSEATLNIYAQTNDEATMGALVASGANSNQQYNAGIGGVDGTAAGTITINGGKINATGMIGAGIGSGGNSNATVGTITINGGIVTAQDSKDYGAGIGGGGWGGKASTINLNGGVIHAAGIGSGYIGGDCSITVNISNGVKKIVATPVRGGACIGSGESASGSVTVNFKSGGNVVTGDAKDAVFYDTGEGSVRQVRAKALNHAVTMSDGLKANITATSEYAFTGETVTLTLGTAVDASTLTVNDGTSDLTLRDAGNRQYTFTMPAGDVTVTATLLRTYAVSLPTGMEVVSATNAADTDGKYITGTTVTFKASFPYAASNVSDGTSTLEPDANGVYTVTVADADVTVTATVERNSPIDLSGATDDFTVINNDVLTGSTSGTVTIASDAAITLSGATITGGIVCNGSATITLAGTNSTTGGYGKAGIQIGGSGTTLTINGDGTLTANGGTDAAGIGLNRAWDVTEDVVGGNIVINGGTITANGGGGGAGIGAGVTKYENNAARTATVGNITITGGTVTAVGGSNADGIGAGQNNYNATIQIGTVTIYDGIDLVDASSIKDFASVVYMHGDGDVTASKTDYFTISENGDRRIIVPKDDTDYTITIADGIEHGTLTVAAATAKYMQTVTVTATPAFGYRFVRLIVKDAQNNDVASTGNSFFMPKGGATVSAVFEQGVHGTTEFVWGYPEPGGFVNEATIYDGVTTVNIQQTGQSYNIRKYNEYTNSKFRLDNSTYDADIPYTGGTGEFYGADIATSFNFPDNGQTGYYDITLTDVGGGKWGVSILPTPAQMDVVPDQTYTGSAITPEPLVIAGSLSLTKGKDYVYSYENNTNVGTATVRATFQGDYESLGYVEKTFIIMPDWTYNTEGGYYEINDAQDLVDLATYVNGTDDVSIGKTFRQTANIDMSSISNFTPIGFSGGNKSFKGTYDGGNFTISNLTVSKDYGDIGLFGAIKDATIRNTVLVSPTVSAVNPYAHNVNLGALIGVCDIIYSTNTVENCHVISPTLTVEGTSSGTNYIGAIIGEVWDKTNVTKCYYYGNYNAFGYSDNATHATNVARVYALTLGDGITATADLTVGTASYCKEGTEVTLTITPAEGYSIGTVKYNDGSDHEITPTNDVYSFTMPASDVTVSATYTFTVVTPQLDSDGYYLIGTAAELYGFAQLVNNGNATANAKLTADIVVNENVLDESGNANTGDFEQWTPIGNDRYNDKVYSGTFDGQGHTISGLYVSGSAADQFFGLIGTAGGSVFVKYLGVVDSYFGNSNNRVGSIVGDVSDGSTVTLANVYSTSTVSGDNWVGGLVGGDGSGSVTIINSYFAGKTSATFLSGQYGTHHDDLVAGEFSMPISGTLNVVNSFVLGTSQYGTSVTAGQLSDGTVAAALHYYQDALADGSIWGVSGGKTGFSGTIDGVSVTTADITLHTFDGNTTAYSSKYVVGITTPLPVNVVREGYTFLGWYDNANFEGDAVTQISSSETGNKEYWAKFVRSHSVSFVLNGGTIQKGEIDHYIEGEATTLPTVVTKNGASFEGWYTEEDFTGDRYYSIPTTATEDMTFYAKWGEAKTMFYLTQGGSPEPVNILYEGENIVWLDKTTMDGYFINDIYVNGWGGSEGDINVPYTGGESTFGNGGRMFNVSQSGFYVFTLTDKGDGKWFISVLYSLADYCTVSDIPDQTYTGSAIEPTVVVTNGETTLTLDTDYTIEYSDNTNVGTATATITGIGNYSGTIEQTFTITPKVLNTYGAISICQDQNGTTAIIDGSSEAAVSITSDVTVEHVTYNRTFTAGRPATVMLPFDYTCNGSEGGTFYTFVGVEYDDSKEQWVATMKEVGDDANKVTHLEPNTPYLFMPSGTAGDEAAMWFPNISGTVTLCTNGDKQTNATGWEFRGVYEKKEWNAPSNDYGFAATSGRDAADEQDVSVGQFVRFTGNGTNNAFIKPMRCYLHFDPSITANARGMNRAAAADELPQTITVRLVNRNGETTDISTLSMDNGQWIMDNYYDLNGRKINGKPSKKGLYINNGKKVVIK